MTTQIAVVNKMGVALASDSVITITNGEESKTLNNARKMFEIGPDHKIVIMIAGNSELNNLPIELFLLRWIKSLREPLPTVRAYSDSFIEWLGLNSTSAKHSESEAIASSIDSFLIDILNDISAAMEGQVPATYSSDFNEWYVSNKAHAKVHNKVSKEVVDRAISNLDNQYTWPFFDAETANKSLTTATAKEMVSGWFTEKALTPALRQRLIECLPHALTKRTDTINPAQTNISFAGYGTDSYTPNVVEFYIEGAMPKMVKGWYSSNAIDGIDGATIYYPAQRKAVRSFLNGYHDDMLKETRRFISESLTRIQNEDWIERNSEGFKEINASFPSVTSSNIRKLVTDQTLITALSEEVNRAIEIHGGQQYSNLMDTLGLMDLSNLAEVAESLAGLQVLAAHNSKSSPNSGGIIEVATIDLQNGVKWHRRIPLTKSGVSTNPIG
jgi:hypothetical protein